ncbi:hypothetical protein F511_05279 [Dorcoceras hygrometricum]|uniref:DUF4378 domain-containing protein n=1 Tax=Dorcoceras hygrometricum TaxID=472368 RepID=A0A2Z7AKG5_9LAMI|nr:hypothetical protein F511_05279 [Dorcoceras hygrometricum]
MGIDKKSSKGGFLQMFDWNAKSRKKLFSSHSDLPEQFKQKKRCDGNLPMTQLQMLDEYEVSAGASIKGGSEYSCASSVTEEDIYATKAPGVVARLMGLDSMPKSSVPQPYSTPHFDSLSVQSSYYSTKNLESSQDPLQGVWSQNIMEPKYQKVIHRPIEKFQTEILPPKSAKSIPVTHHKLLSPIKSVNFIPSKDAAQIMEAAARIIEPGPQASTKSKLLLVGSSSGPLRIRDLKEKAQATQKTSNLFERSHESSELCTNKNIREHLLNKSWDGLVDAEELTSIGKNRGKSISLALQAKANVKKREGLNLNGSRSVAGKEASELNSNQLFKNQSITQSALKRPTSHNSSSVLRQNNQKQNCMVDKGKLPLKSGGKVVTVDSTTSSHKDSKNFSGNSKVSSRKWGSDLKDDKGEVLGSRSERVTRKKRSIDGSYQPERNQAAQSMRTHKNGKSIQSSAIVDGQTRWDQDSRGNGVDIVSFTFTSPMRRSGSGSDTSMDIGENHKMFTSDSRSKKALLSSEGISSSKFSFRGHNLRGSDMLSALLEQKLKELTHAVEFSNLKTRAVLHDSVLSPNTEPTAQQENTKGGVHPDNIFSGACTSFCPADSQNFTTTSQKYQEGTKEETIEHCNSTSQSKISIDRRLPSPVSVLEHHSFLESCNSSDTASSNFSCKKNSSSIYAQGLPGTYTLGTLLTIEGDAELSDSASSSTAAKTLATSQETSSTLANCVKPMKWELAYIKDIICNIDQSFTDYALGRARTVIKPHLFDQMERQKRFSNGPGGPIPQTNRRVLFQCVSECLDLKCRQYVVGGSKQWIKGLSWVRRKERLAEEIYDEISGWIAIGDSLVDELVDKDMSSHHGRWLDFETEAFELGIQIQSRILNSLIDEVVADMLVL